MNAEASLNKIILNKDDTTPLYLQLMAGLRQMIVTNELPSGAAIPSERALVELLGISRVTARRAIQSLLDQGLVKKNQGSGTFVMPRFVQDMPHLDSFSSMLKPSGLKPNSELVNLRRYSGSKAAAAKLGLSIEQDIIELTRLRKAGDIPISLDIALLPAAVVPDVSMIGPSLYSYLDTQGFPILRAKQRFNCIGATSEIARHLCLAEGTPVMKVTRVGYSHAEQIVEYTTSYCIDEYYDFVVELR